MTKMISYAQNREDVLLSRLFPQGYKGFYVDIGSNHPTHCSITRYFSGEGWTGINVEPGQIFSVLKEGRPNDINLNVAVSDKRGQATFFEYPDRSTDSTLCAAVADDNDHQFGATCNKRVVETRTLTDICDEYVGSRSIDFLAIDVEGHELNVVRGMDWRRWRPRVVIVEATRPHSSENADLTWEQMLLENDYLYAAFDGLNRFYVRKEDDSLLGLLKAPVCVFDEFTSYHHLLELEQARQSALRASGKGRCASLFTKARRSVAQSFRRLLGAERKA